MMVLVVNGTLPLWNEEGPDKGGFGTLGNQMISFKVAAFRPPQAIPTPDV